MYIMYMCILYMYIMHMYILYMYNIQYVIYTYTYIYKCIYL